MRYIICTLILLYTSTTSYSQRHNKGWSAPIKGHDGVLTEADISEMKEVVVKAREYQLPDKDADNSAFAYYSLAISASQKGDSVTARELFLKIDPYFILSLNVTDSTIIPFLKRYNITRAARNAYKDKFTSVYFEEHSAAFDTFRRFYNTVMSKKKRMDTARGDSKEYTLALFIQTDSVQFAQLHNYLKRNGWPSLKDGSVYAAQIAARDIEHFSFYLPYLANAVSNGKLSLHLAEKIDENRYHYYEYMFIKAHTKLPYSVFDVSTFRDMYRQKFLASAIVRENIFHNIEQNCPITDFFHVNYSNNMWKAYNNFSANNKRACMDIVSAINKHCDYPHNHQNSTACRHIFLPNLYYSGDRELFYVIH